MICKAKVVYLGYNKGSFTNAKGQLIEYIHISLTTRENPTEIIITTINKEIDIDKLIPFKEYNIEILLSSSNKHKVMSVTSV